MTETNIGFLPNTNVSNVVTVSGIVTSFNAVHAWNASRFIVVTLEPQLIVVNDSQPSQNWVNVVSLVVH